jgi:hypothetical protein
MLYAHMFSDSNDGASHPLGERICYQSKHVIIEASDSNDR